MNKEILREKVIEYLSEADETLLYQVNEIISAYHKTEIIGSRPDGTTLTKEQLLADIKIAEKQIEEGEFISAEALKEEIKKWSV